MNRRGFLTSVAGFLAAPAIVRAGSLMPVSVVPMEARAILPLPYKITTAEIRRLLLPRLYVMQGSYNEVFDDRRIAGAGQ